MKSGSLVVALVTVLLFLTSAASPQTIQPVNGLIVVDANGKKVGNVIGAPHTTEGISGGAGNYWNITAAAVELAIQGHMLVLEVGRDGFLFGPYVDFSFLYHSSSCSGTPYVFAPEPDSWLSAPFVVNPGRTLFIADPHAAPTQPQTGDTWSCYYYEPNPTCHSAVVGGNNGGYYCAPDPTQRVVPAIALVDLSTQFAPPFSLVPDPVSAAACCGDCNGDGVVTVDEILTSVNNALNGCTK